MRSLTCLAVCLLPWVSSLAADDVAVDWTRFRGPNGTGISHAKTIPLKWNADDYNWTTELPGTGHGSPVVVGSNLYVICGDRKTAERMVVCVDVNQGTIRWRKNFKSKAHRLHSANMSRKSAMMLAASTAVLRSQWPYVAGKPHYENAYEKGMKFWEDYYSREALKEIPVHLKTRHWQKAVQAAGVFIRYAGHRGERTLREILSLTKYYLLSVRRRLIRVTVGRVKLDQLRQLISLNKNRGNSVRSVSNPCSIIPILFSNDRVGLKVSFL